MDRSFVKKEEPYCGPLTEQDNVLVTQHVRSCSFDCRDGMEIEAVQDLIRFFKDEALENEVPEEEYIYQCESCASFNEQRAGGPSVEKIINLLNSTSS